jgi:hypothetical protein
VGSGAECQSLVAPSLPHCVSAGSGRSDSHGIPDGSDYKVDLFLEKFFVIGKVDFFLEQLIVLWKSGFVLLAPPLSISSNSRMVSLAWLCSNMTESAWVRP